MHRWFHPSLGGDEAEKMLLDKGTDGSFVVRPSKSCAGHFTLSVRRRDFVTHIKIRHSGNFFDLNGGEKFATLADLVQHYIGKKLYDKSGEYYEIRSPLNFSNPITERWFHGSISGIEAERLLLDQGSDGSFLVRESQSNVGGYVVTVRKPKMTKDDSTKKPADKIAHVMIQNNNGKYTIGCKNTIGGLVFNSLSEFVEYYKQHPLVETDGTVVNLVQPFNGTRIIALDIDARIRELSKENPATGFDGFWEEFEHLQLRECRMLLDRKIGQKDSNMLKNRHKNILPYDFTRVILKKPNLFENDDEFNSDYINANYIKLVEDDNSSFIAPNSKVYIATQGPLPHTINDFWWMVWQEKSECIVMVTRETEGGKNKCCRYWPTMEMSTMRCGPLEIKIISDTSATTTSNRNSTNTSGSEDYTFREFELKCLGGDENDCLVVRRVVHYQYNNWLDQNIPSDPSSVLNFLQHINRRYPKEPFRKRSPMIVHCSAGIGRSGTLIVIDMLIDQLSLDLPKYCNLFYEIDIQRMVKIARAQRCGLVQTVAQYKFIYLALQNYIASCIQNK